MVTAAWQKIEKGTVDPVYLVTGTEQYLIDATINRIQKSLSKQQEIDIIRFDLEETPIELVIEEADTLPFFHEQKLIVAMNASFLKAQDKSKEKVVHRLEALENWLQHPSPTATVVFTAPYEKTDSRKKITKLMHKTANVIEAVPIQGRDLTAWIQQQASANSTSISFAAAEFLIQMGGNDLGVLSNEIKKMASYLNGEGAITEELIEQMVSRTPEMDVFRLTEAYIARNPAKTIGIYHDLLRAGEEPIMLTGLLAGQIRLMLHVQSMRKKGYAAPQIAGILKVHPYRVKLVLENRNLPHPERLMAILHKLATIDHLLKSTSGKRERILELFFMDPL